MFVGDGSHPLDKQFRVGRFFGIPTYVHIILVLFFAMQVLVGLFTFSFTRLLVAVLWPLILFGSVYLHELGHALTSAHFNNPPRRIVMHLFGGVAEVPPRLGLREQLWVIANGPLVSLVLAVIGYVLYLFLGGVWLVGALVYYLFFINLILLIFNVLPIFPLDGGQFLRQWLTLRKGQTFAIQRSLPWSFVMLILVGLYCLGTGSIFGFVIVAVLGLVNHREWQRWGHLFQGDKGFWGYLVPSGDLPGFGNVSDRLYVWRHRSSAEVLMRKADEEGVFNLKPEERKRLERYLEAKVRLRGGKHKQQDKRKDYMN